MIINDNALHAIFTAFKSAFNTAGAKADTSWQQIASEVPSSSSSNTYGWLGQFPAFREWVGERVLKDVAAHGYAIENKSYESSIVVSRNDIEDDQVGIYKPLIEEMGRAAAVHPDELIYGLLKEGITRKCYDGKAFFAPDHPVGETPVAVSNFQDGDGPAWYLLDVSRSLKPLIFQVRRKYNLIAMSRPEDESVFMRNECRYGVDARVNAGFGFWQFAYCSKAPLTPENYEAARAAMLQFKSDQGRPLGIIPKLLVVPPALEGKARTLLVKDGNNENPWTGSAVPLVSPWLAY
ncbi:Mu-like prophage major head subunit gpT family protein [Pseudomonas huaxiensis]|uniref:Mu-like prophage major head subunit gpT family protein n=1 Tax=Pseudomonas huaxiensis TaxID=2213017 RepID=UPI000DA64B1D|nr:Mu-like prophage major head subunit gpT family protein [Pseudomonas huaxiensis]